MFRVSLRVSEADVSVLRQMTSSSEKSLHVIVYLSARPPRETLWCHVLALPPDRKGLSRLWVPLFGMAFPLTFVLCCGSFPVLYINSSRLSSLAEPVLEVVILKGRYLSSYIDINRMGCI